MAYIDSLYDNYFLEYASYYIKERAIPHVDDGLKPVQRRILHSLNKIDDGKFHKVANVVGQTMQYHPHGDQSIYGALVVLANKDLFIEKQGNFGNIHTGDEAAAGRDPCALNPMLPGRRWASWAPGLTESERWDCLAEIADRWSDPSDRDTGLRPGRWDDPTTS